MFDSFYVKCPKCRHQLEFQSKSGPCLLDSYDKTNLPIEVAIGLNEDIVKCNFCNTNWKIQVKIPKMVKVRLIKTKAMENYSGNFNPNNRKSR